MSKDINWLKVQMNRPIMRGNEFENGYYDAVDKFNNLVRQVKQPELPVVPDFVAEWFEEARKRKSRTLSAVLDYFAINYGRSPELLNWVKSLDGPDNNDSPNTQRVIARMYLDGYTVEEQKYKVLNSKNVPVLVKISPDVVVGVGLFRNREDHVTDLSGDFDILLTEKEIKDFDERYWTIATPADKE